MKIKNRNYKKILQTLVCCLAFGINTPFIFAQCPDDIDFTKQYQVDDFSNDYPNCTEIKGNVRLSLGFIDNLEGFSKVKIIKGDLIMESLTEIHSFTGFDNLVAVGGDLIIKDNDHLETLDGLDGLKRVGGQVLIEKMILLPNFRGLHNLETIGGSLSISSNSSIDEFWGFDRLQKIGSFLRIFNNSAPSLVGMRSLREVRGSIEIINNELESLRGLSNLCEFDGPLVIQNNFSLSECQVEAFCDYLAVPSNQATISVNSGDCKDRTALEDYCQSNSSFPKNAVGTCNQVLSVDRLNQEKLKFALAPNPSADGQVQITLSLEEMERIQLSVFDINGRLRSQYQIEPSSLKDRLEYDFSFLESGMYLVRLEQARGVAYRKLLIGQ